LQTALPPKAGFGLLHMEWCASKLPVEHPTSEQ